MKKKNDNIWMDITQSVWGDPNLISSSQSDSDEQETVEEALMDVAWQAYDMGVAYA